MDNSRTWAVTRGYARNFSPDLSGRPIRISLWYPAASRSGRAMTYGDYVLGDPPVAYKAYDALVRAHDLVHSRLNVPIGALPKFLATPVNAYFEAVPEAGRFPLVIYCDGLDGDTVSNVVLAEYLASNGFVVATIPIVGPDSDHSAQTRTAHDLETTVRDLEFVWHTLRSMPNVDQANLSVMGHSLGAVEAVLFATRNGDVSKVVGLDGTYGFAGATGVLTGFYDYDPMHMAAALLDLRREQTNSGPSAFVLDLSAVNAMHFSPRTLVTLKGMYHTDFTDFGILAKLFHFPPFADRNYDLGSAGYQSVSQIVRDFLQSDAARLDTDVAAAPGGAVRRLGAVPLPPTPREMVSIASVKGLQAAKDIIARYKRDVPDDVIVDEANYDALGYTLLDQKRYGDAILALQIDTYVYPQSANLADSLGDMYAGAGETMKARDAYRHGLDLLSDDPELNAAGKDDMKLTLLQAMAKLDAVGK
jgi:dienelactone hydrolase